jgi:hypothetical protein
VILTRSAKLSRTLPLLQKALTSSSVPLGAARTLVGAAVLARPTLLAKGLGLDAATAQRTAWLARMFAGRDLALGVGALSGSRGCQLAGVASDFSDFGALVIAIKAGHVKALPGALAAVTAAGAVAVGGAGFFVTRK